jgi:hypothetical protein
MAFTTVFGGVGAGDFRGCRPLGCSTESNLNPRPWLESPACA